MITVFFDLLYAQPFGDIKYHGGGEYIKSVFEALIERNNGSYRLEVCYNKDAFLDEWILKSIEEKGIKSHQVKSASDIVNVLKQVAGTGQVRFFTGMIYPYDHVDFPEGIVAIGVCHGLRTMEKLYDSEAWRYIASKADLKVCITRALFRARYTLKAMESFTRLFRKFDIIVTDSQHSAYSIRVNLPEIAQKTNLLVFYAPSKCINISEEDRTDVQPADPYIMMINANRWVKNSYRGLMAIDGLYRNGYLKGIKTRVYGKLPPSIQNKLICKEQYEFFGYVSTEELEAAYRNCKVFFYPTLNEGFGLPPSEALKYGKTCVTSAVCSLPEVYGESVYYCNPYDLIEMQSRILQAVDTEIPLDVIQAQLTRIQNKQAQDLSALCMVIEGLEK